MAIEKSSLGKHTIYQDPTLKGKTLLGFKGDAFLEAGYIYAPYIPMYTTPTIMSREQIKEETRVPIKIIKAAMKQAGYKINRDFIIQTDPFSATVVVSAQPGRRFTDYGQCRASTMRKGKLSITWTYDPSGGYGAKDSKNVDVTLADPGCFQQISETIVRAVKENQTKPATPGIYARYGYNKGITSPYYSTIKVTI